MTFADADRRFMTRALELAARGLRTTDPNPRVGAVVARGEDILGEGWHERAGEPHAEAFALREAGERARGATLYVTLEPCSHHGRTAPCVEAVLAAGIERVVGAMQDPNPQVNGGGFTKLRAAGVTVEIGLMESEARELNPGFVHRIHAGRPWVRLKLGVSLDGRTALASGESRWITSEQSREDVQYWRARSSVVLTGLATVLRDDPRLDVRLQGTTRQPLRVVLDTNLEIPAEAKILAPPGAALIFTAAPRAPVRAAIEARGARVAGMARSPSGGLDLGALLKWLAEEQVNEVLVECGSRLAGAFVAEGLVDELIVYVAPSILGSGARGMFDLPPLASLTERSRWRFTDVRRVGEDLRIVARPTARSD